MITYKTMSDIKRAIDNGIKVYWMHKGYQVIKTNNEYGILFYSGNYVGIESAQNPDAYFSEVSDNAN